MSGCSACGGSSGYSLPASAGGGGGGGGGGTPPDAVAGMRSWWDAFDEANYTADPFLASIDDKGPDAVQLVAPTPAAGVTSANINGVPTDMPGPFFNALSYNFVENRGYSESLTDFSLFMILPLNATGTTNDCIFAFSSLGPSVFWLQVKNSTISNTFWDITDSAVGVLASFEAPKDAAYASGSSAIVAIRRGSGRLKVDVWYDVGAGVVKPAQVDIADPYVGAQTLEAVAFGGRGSITFSWATNYIHTTAWWDRELTDAEVLGLAQWAGGTRLGIGPIT